MTILYSDPVSITRKTFNIARMICNAVSGTDEVYRPIENNCLNKPPVAHFPRESHTMVHVNRHDQFLADVRSVRSMLDRDGNYTALSGCILSSPVEIADAILMSGITWVSCKMVKNAQKQIRKSLQIVENN